MRHNVFPSEQSSSCLAASLSLSKENTNACLMTVHNTTERLWESTTLHDAEELLLVDFAIAITVSLIDHLLELLIGHVLSEFLGHTLQVLEGDLAGLVIVEEAEHLDDLLTGVTVTHASGH